MKVKTVLLFLMLFTTSSWAESNLLKDLIEFSEKNVVENTAKASSLREVGMVMGARLGFSERAVEIRNEARETLSELSRVVNFSRFIDRDGWMPPVVEYVSSSFDTDGTEANSSGERFKIVKPAHFVMAPPTVSDYLFVGLPDAIEQLDPLPSSLHPSNDAERKIWRDAVVEGYKNGRDSADTILEENIRKLKRDYLGMMIYQSLLHRGMITRPMVAKAEQDAEITPIQITKLKVHKEFALPSEFVENRKKWKREVYVDR